MPRDKMPRDRFEMPRDRFVTSLKTIEPYRLKELILQDLKYHPKSMISEMNVRLPDIPFKDLQNKVRKMTMDGELSYEGGRKYRRYSLL